MFLAANHTSVHTAQADGLAVAGAETGHQVFIDLAGQNHLDHFHGLLVSIPQAVDKLGLLADLLEQLIDIGAAAVDQHRFDAQHVEQDDILHDGVL